MTNYNGKSGTDGTAQCKQFSVWLSEGPYTGTNDNFFSLGSQTSVSGTDTYGGTTTGILGSPSSKAVYVDPSTGSLMNITIETSRTNPFDTYDYTNDAVEDKLDDIMNEIQFEQNAYILRIFRADWNSSSTETTYHDFYVYLENADTSSVSNNPQVMNISLSFNRRNRSTGFGSV